MERNKLYLFLVLLLMLTGCGKALFVRPPVDEAISTLIDREIRCENFPQTTCAIDSELHNLADQAFSNSLTDSPKHFVSVLNYGQDALLTRIHLIRAAKKSIDLQTYIWANDEVGQFVFNELLKAARRGVKVRVIVDQITVKEDPALLAKLATSHINLEIAFYNPVFSHGKTTPLTLTQGMFSFKRIDQRMHNKILVVDEQIGIVGGRNIENKYYDYDPAYSFKDRDVIVIGPAVKEKRESFEQYWNNEVVVKAIYLVDVGKEIIKLDREEPYTLFNEPEMSLFSDIDILANRFSISQERQAISPFSVGMVKFYADLPGKPPKRRVKEYKNNPAALREVLRSTTKSLTVQTPYLVLSRTARATLKKMKKQNPDLEITISSNSLASTDVHMIYGITFKQKREIVKNLEANLYEFKPFPGGAREYILRYDRLISVDSPEDHSNPPEQSERLPVMNNGLRVGLHAKSFVVDSNIVVVGSHNLDPRSANINTESVVIIWDEKIASAIEQSILLDTKPQNSWIIAKRETVPFISYFSNIIGSISSLLPVLDVWPFRYTSSYELNKGMEPIPADHPDFYTHYKDVGQFPEVNLSLQSIQTRLIKTFGGFIAPLM
jgi:phosphatidylserine/phosphatidylglycerophosphate/cardiolipin synthase-like enzyme